MKTAKLALLPGLLLLLVAYAGAQSPGKAASTGTSLPVAAAAPGPAVPAPNPMPSHSNTTQAAASAGRQRPLAPGVSSEQPHHHWLRIAIISVAVILGVVAILAYRHNNSARCCAYPGP